ncbi:TIGR04255 family protein [Dactylosporangium sp. AC04546]|uniref:TIGR04255 family protein n=1 Tax=Dactylosporangium sp. AC04546 TaxID=2862460 RepID=UPI001EDFCC71|nr:TIGR04255 family protein [Dactylosporangium sp. AC04546]WVK83956.1 TIGR04255 family protein [Dactylosporangium sp. AC04546]
MVQRYRRPPILEATFECRFKANDAWDLSAPAELYKSLREEYPDAPTTVASGSLEVVEDAKGSVVAAPALRLGQTSLKYQFSAEGGQRLVRVGNEVLTVHATAPYPGWPTFREQITYALRAYVRVAKPDVLTRFGMRFVNRIDLEGPTVELSDYLTIPVDPPRGLGFDLSSFLLRMEAVRPDGIKLIQTFASAPVDGVSVILDLDVISDGLELPVTDDESWLSDKIEYLREIEREAFEVSITDKLRERFNEH